MHSNHQRTVNRIAAIIENERRHARVAMDSVSDIDPEAEMSEDGQLNAAVKWSARGLLAVFIAGIAAKAFLMMQGNLK